MAILAESPIGIHDDIDTLDPIEREVLALCPFEHLGGAETALVFGVSEQARVRRYIHALRRLKENLTSMPGAPEDL